MGHLQTLRLVVEDLSDLEDSTKARYVKRLFETAQSLQIVYTSKSKYWPDDEELVHFWKRGDSQPIETMWLDDVWRMD